MPRITARWPCLTHCEAESEARQKPVNWNKLSKGHFELFADSEMDGNLKIWQADNMITCNDERNKSDKK